MDLVTAGTLAISDKDFAYLQGLMQRVTGISLSPAKKPLVCSRLMKRLRHYNLPGYGAYIKLLTSGTKSEELQLAIDLLTTNETYFFREPKHFEFLREALIPSRQAEHPLRVWSAACSSGEEPYSIAMVIAQGLGTSPWQVLASDISSRILAKARSGHYAMERARQIPPPYLSSYCLKGIGAQEGTFLVDKKLRERIEFHSINLNAPLPDIGPFDVIFLRNVMIYFDAETKRQVISRLVSVLASGGYLFISHSESLHGIRNDLKPVQPAIYRKV